MLQDLKFALRRLRRSPGFALIAVVTLTLAVGVNAAIFSVADAVLFRPLPYQDPERVFFLAGLNKATGQQYGHVPKHYLAQIDAHHSGLGKTAYFESGLRPVVEGKEGARRVPTLAVTTNFFQVLGVRAAQGRIFEDRDEIGPGRPAMLSYRAWQEQFGGDYGIIGRSVPIGSMTIDVIGALPPDFIFPSTMSDKPEVFFPMPRRSSGPTDGAIQPIVRLEPGVTRKQALVELETLIAPLAKLNSGGEEATLTLAPLKQTLFLQVRPLMKLLTAAAAFVLMIGCVNLALMLLARSKRNEFEIGVRVALGAGRFDLIRPVLFESILVSLAGSTLALLLTWLTADALIRNLPIINLAGVRLGVDLRVIVYTLALGMIAGLVFSIGPAWRSTRIDALALIQKRNARSGGRRGRTGPVMISLQVALALSLVFGAVIAGRGMIGILRAPMGFSPENTYTIEASPDMNMVKGLARQEFYKHAIETLAKRSDVAFVGAASAPPISNVSFEDGVKGENDQKSVVGIQHVLPGYFETIQQPLLFGRLPQWNDVQGGGDVAVLSESAARALFPTRDPIGETFSNLQGRRYQVVGVVRDTTIGSELKSKPAAFVIPGILTRNLMILVRVRTSHPGQLSEFRQAMNGVAPGAPATIALYTDSIRNMTIYRNPRFQTMILGAFAGLALLLTALGVFGVVAHAIETRTHEFGVRMALGAQPQSIVRMILYQTLIPVVIGLIAGSMTTLWISPIAKAQLYKVETYDPAMLWIAALTALFTALLAAYPPARRASRIDPLAVLRTE
jgi:putative ABC transport system permease protein